MCVIFLRITSETKSQQLNPNDTICFKIQEVQNLLIVAKQGNGFKERVTILNERIVNLQGIIQNLQERDSATVVGYEKRISELYLQKGIYETEIARLEKENRKLRRKVRWTAIAGVLSTAGAFFIGLGGLK